MNPPDNAIILSMIKKTQIQALDHTQFLQQLASKHIERNTHDYVREQQLNMLHLIFKVAKS